MSLKADMMSSVVAEVVERRPFEPGVAVAVVPLPLLLVGEDLVRLGRFLELLLGLVVARVVVRVVLQGQLPVGFLDVVGRGVAADSEHFVKIALGRGHRHGVSAVTSARGSRDGRPSTRPNPIDIHARYAYDADSVTYDAVQRGSVPHPTLIARDRLA